MSLVILMGAPGAGKGTQARRLQDTMGLIQIASGDLFREHFKNKTELGDLARTFIDAGELVPDEVTISMVAQRLARPDCSNGAVLDGFPRTVPQAEALEDIASDMGTWISIVACIDVASEILLKRLSGRWTCIEQGHVFHEMFKPPAVTGICDIDGSKLYQRDDDSEETQRRRIEIYGERTSPLIDYYLRKGLLVRINGEQPIDQVHKDLVAAIREAESPLAA